MVRYSPGLPIEEVARRYGITDIVKLASNENPLPPFPEVSAAIAEIASGVNRYPDSGCFELTRAVSGATGIPEESLWFGAGSSELLSAVARAVGGAGTSFVFGWPSFAMYPVNAGLGGAEAIHVPLDGEQRYDLDAMAGAIRADTTLVFVCNPNNPTGTYRSHADVTAFIEGVDPDVLVIVDEAYAEYVVADDYESAIPLALERPNVVVARTFSKMYGLAGLRVGYMVGGSATLGSLKRAQLPFSGQQPGPGCCHEIPGVSRPGGGAGQGEPRGRRRSRTGVGRPGHRSGANANQLHLDAARFRCGRHE